MRPSFPMMKRYVLINSQGGFEILTADKFRYTNGGRELRIFGLDVTGSARRLIATLSKNNITNKVKNSIKTNSIIVNKSKLSSSGIGSTTLNDGLLMVLMVMVLEFKTEKFVFLNQT